MWNSPCRLDTSFVELFRQDLVTFLVGLIFGIKFMIQAKTQDKEEYERKKSKDELERKETELRYQKMLEDRS